MPFDIPSDRLVDPFGRRITFTWCYQIRWIIGNDRGGTGDQGIEFRSIDEFDFGDIQGGIVMLGEPIKTKERRGQHGRVQSPGYGRPGLHSVAPPLGA